MTLEERSRLEALDRRVAIGQRARTHSLYCSDAFANNWLTEKMR